MKKLTAILLAVLLVGVMGTSALAGTPWEDTSSKIALLSTFDDITAGPIDTTAEPFWSGTYNNQDNPMPCPFKAKIEDGKFVVYGAIEGVDVITDYFRLSLNASLATDASKAQQAAAEGIGFYMENNSEMEQQMGLFFIGSACLMTNGSSYIYFVDLAGNVTEAENDGNNGFYVPAGFKGYVLFPVQYIMDAWVNQEAWNPATKPFGAFGLQFIYVMLDEAKGETLVFDNIFAYGPNVTENNDGVIPLTAATATAAITATPAITAVPTAVTGTPTAAPAAAAAMPTWAWVAIIGGAVLVLALLIFALTSKKPEDTTPPDPTDPPAAQ